MRTILYSLIAFLVMVSPCWAGASRDLDGTDDFIDYGNSTELDSADNVTVSFWVYWSTFGTSAYHSIVSKRLIAGASGGNPTNFGFNYNGAGGTDIFQWYFNTADTFRVNSITLSSNFSTGVWTNITGVFSRNGTNTDSTIYKNGASIATASLTGNVVVSTANLNIGRLVNGTEYADINISHLQIFSRALSASEIVQIMNKPGSLVNSLIFYSPVMGDSPELDLTGQGNTGAVTGASDSALGPPVMLTSGAAQ